MATTGTTRTSGWAVFLFLVGFTTLGTAAIGGGAFSLIGGAAVIGVSCFLFRQARIKEGA